MPFPTFKTEDEIPEAFRASYVEQDGEWVVPEPEAPKPLGDGGKKALDAERDARKVAEDALKALEAEAADLRQKASAQKAGITDEQLKTLRAEIRADIEKEYSPLKEEAEKLRGENRGLRLDSNVKKIAGENGVRPERLDQWWRQFGDRFELTDDGKPMVKSSPGIEVANFVSGELKKEFPELYVGSQIEGGDAGGLQPGQKGGRVSVDSIMANPTQALTDARGAA